MRFRSRPGFSLAVVLVSLLAAAAASAQTKAQAPTPTPAPGGPPGQTDAPPARAPEGERIINFPSAEVPRPGTLTILFTHRFAQSLEESDIHSLYSFDSGAEIGIGLGYTPVKNLNISLYRSSNLDDYELDAKYHLFTAGPIAAALRAGADWRTERRLENRSTYFAQAIVAISIGTRVRLTAIPTYVSKSPGQLVVSSTPFYKDVFNLGGAISIGITRTFNVQAEVMGRRRKTESGGVGWIASIEKTVPRHRFAFTVGNQRATTVDQYVTWTPEFFGQSPHRFFIGFNIVRQWKL